MNVPSFSDTSKYDTRDACGLTILRSRHIDSGSSAQMCKHKHMNPPTRKINAPDDMKSSSHHRRSCRYVRSNWLSQQYGPDASGSSPYEFDDNVEPEFWRAIEFDTTLYTSNVMNSTNDWSKKLWWTRNHLSHIYFYRIDAQKTRLEVIFSYSNMIRGTRPKSIYSYENSVESTSIWKQHEKSTGNILSFIWRWINAYSSENTLHLTEHSVNIQHQYCLHCSRNRKIPNNISYAIRLRLVLSAPTHTHKNQLPH